MKDRKSRSPRDMRAIDFYGPTPASPLAQYLVDHDLRHETLAKALKVHKSMISLYITGRRRIPGERAVAIERALGIPRETLRPDLYE